MILRPGDLLGLSSPDLVHQLAAFRYVMVALVLAWALITVRARPLMAVAMGMLYAILAVGFWTLALGRPYGLFVDATVTRRLAECAVAATSGGWEGFLSGQAAQGAGAWLGRHGVSPRLLMFGPALLAPLVVPVVGFLVYQLWSCRDRAWVAAVLWLAFPTGDLDALRRAGLVPGLWSHPLGALGVVVSALAVVVATRRRDSRRGLAVCVAGAAAWLAAGAFWARLGESVTPLGMFDRVLLVTLDQGLWLPLGWYGLLRRGEPASRALALAGLVVLLLPLPAAVRVEPWGPHALYRLGLMMAAAAPAAELCALLGAAVKRWRGALGDIPDVRVGAAAALLALGPGSFLVWWHPVQLDPVMADSLEPVPSVVLEVSEAVRTHTTPQSVVLAGREYAPAVAALAGRRVLRAPSLLRPPDEDARWTTEEKVLAGRGEGRAARRYGVTHVLAAIGDFADHGLQAPEQLATRPGFRLAWQHPEGIRLYALQ